ncbi:MAG: YCF48-related protein [Bacteroidetes bacterium]|nr:YCF48-related protein [Bacteroidota bacterium]
MKKVYFLVWLLQLSPFVFSQWELQNPLPSGNTLSSVYFCDANTGYAVGLEGTIVKTINGGTTWTVLSSGTTTSLSSVYFTDVSKGVAVGLGGTILKTTNGGTDWMAVSSGTTNDLNSVCFADLNTGYVAGEGGAILKTNNGGINSICFTDANMGHVVSKDGLILKTQDGGMSWTPYSMPSGMHWLLSVCFPDVSTGYAVCYVLTGKRTVVQGRVIKTTDGGTTWFDLQAATDGKLNSVYFTDANTGYCVGDHGTIIKTTDGGAHWATSSSGTAYNLLSVCFTDATKGYAVGDYGTILKTTNGGGVGLNDLPDQSKALNICPNHSSTEITIETFAATRKSRLSVFNINGQDIISRQITGPKTLLDIHTFPIGIYYVRLTNDKYMMTGKFIKE